MSSNTFVPRLHDLSIWAFAFGYFACYVPYSALTKALSSGIVPGTGGAIAGVSLLPSTVLASTVGMMVFLTVMGWWKYATHTRVAGIDLPRPTRWTLFSGLCTAAIVMTTTLAYTFTGVSIVFVMLLMRGGVLILAPLVDRLSGRKVRWFSWVGLLLSLTSLLLAINDRGSYDITLLCAIDVAVYLLSYFVRLRFMSHIAKSSEGLANRRYFVEEQMVATPLLLAVLGIVALVGSGETAQALRHGFALLTNANVALWGLGIGLLSQGTGVFGGLILLDSRENTYCVPVNRCSSVLAGVGASYVLWLWLGERPPSVRELIGAGLIIGAILFLTLPPMWEARQRRMAQRSSEASVPKPAMPMPR